MIEKCVFKFVFKFITPDKGVQFEYVVRFFIKFCKLITILVYTNVKLDKDEL